MKILALIRLLRLDQWVKNLFVFLPMFFSGHLMDLSYWGNAIAAFLSFSFMASAVYCLNDVRDASADRNHPVKRMRPVASGDVSVGCALVVMSLLVVLSFASLSFLPPSRRFLTAVAVAVYLALNVAYSLKLKQFSIIDVLIVSFGFVLRLLAGGVSCGVWLSPWIVCLTFLLALFLAFAKRRDDVVLLEDKGIMTRKNIVHYNLSFINQVLGILAAVTIVCYIMYTVSPEVIDRFGNEYVYATSVFVLAGILRYLQIAMVDKKSGSPTKILLRDGFIQLCVVGWVLTFSLIIYL